MKELININKTSFRTNTDTFIGTNFERRNYPNLIRLNKLQIRNKPYTLYMNLNIINKFKGYLSAIGLNESYYSFNHEKLSTLSILITNLKIFKKELLKEFKRIGKMNSLISLTIYLTLYPNCNKNHILAYFKISKKHFHKYYLFIVKKLSSFRYINRINKKEYGLNEYRVIRKKLVNGFIKTYRYKRSV